MKLIILAGGAGTRLSEETAIRPKPMVEIGGKPILWHIMKIYAAHGVRDFVICAGYKGHVIKRYFADYFLENSDVTFDVASNRTEFHVRRAEPWRVSVIDTGEDTMTGGRLRRVREHLDQDTFCMTYGDGVSNVDISALIRFHETEGSLGTLTAVRPPGRFGAVTFDRGTNRITSFREKPRGDGGWINGGFFVLNRKVIDYIESDSTVFEAEPLKRVAAQNQLAAYKHEGFWQPVDTLRDKKVLEDLWASGRAPWKIWSNGNGS